jgi:hypothetical protein
MSRLPNPSIALYETLDTHFSLVSLLLEAREHAKYTAAACLTVACLRTSLARSDLMTLLNSPCVCLSTVNKRVHGTKHESPRSSSYQTEVM